MKKYQIEEGTMVMVYENTGVIKKGCEGIVTEDLLLTDYELIRNNEIPCKEDSNHSHTWYIFKYGEGTIGLYDFELTVLTFDGKPEKEELKSVQNTLENTSSETLVNTGSDFSDSTVH